MAVNPVTNKIYVANYSSANVTVIDGATNTQRHGRRRVTQPSPSTRSPTKFMWPTTSGNVTVINGATNTLSHVGAGIPAWP